MLDITGSMCDSAPDLDDAPCTKGVKLTAMKTAASNLVKSMLATDELKTRVRVAVVPFSDGVRLPVLPKLAAAGLSPAVQTFPESYKSCNGYGQNCVTKYNYYYYHPTDCVTERMGDHKYDDTAPGPGNYVTNFMRRGTSLLDSTPVEFGCTLGDIERDHAADQQQGCIADDHFRAWPPRAVRPGISAPHGPGTRCRRTGRTSGPDLPTIRHPIPTRTTRRCARSRS